ncbi:MAG: hypothetical protein IPM57_00290 [Oligoflexia bacterium]|nr:hypothetical protein [Oligoflexia bacterium]
MTEHRPSLLKRKFLVDPKVQLKVVLLLGGVAILCSIAICYIAYSKMIQLGVLFNGGIVPPALVPQTFATIAESLMSQLILVVITMIIVFVFLGIYLTHKLTGPIWKLQNELKRHINGQTINPIQFRKGDAFKELPGLINKIINK